MVAEVCACVYVSEEGECSWVCLPSHIAVAALPYIIDRMKNVSKFVMERAGWRGHLACAVTKAH